MDKIHNKLTQKDSTSHKTDRGGLFIGGILVLIIASTPFMFYSYESFPSVKSWETSFFTVNTSYASIAHFAWYFIGKAVPLLLLLIWFFTCKHWWHWIILVPIAMYAFQLWGIINESNNFDVLEIYYIVPLLIVLVPGVYLIRAKLFNEVRGKDLKTFEEDLLVKKTLWGQIKDLFQ